jgi:MtrB/PioB family decaheme-associated outer membrane protein
MKRATPDRRKCRGTVRILSAGLPILLVAAGPPAQDPEAKRRELMTQQSEIELGFLWNADDSNYFGDFTGLVNDGFYVLGNGDIRHRTAWDDPDPWYLHLRGLNLGLDSREAFAEAKRPGRYGAYFIFDQTPKYWNEGGEIFFGKQGDSAFTLPPTWTALTGNAYAVDPSFFRSVDSRFMRETLGGGISAVLMEDLDFSAAYDHQDRWGRYYTGAAFGTTGGNPRSVTLPERVDETTQTWETALAYAVELFQLDLHYEGSRYVNHESRVLWQNPYDAGPFAAAVGYPTGFGQKAQAPDNWFNQVVASGGYNLPWNTRVTGNAAFGWMNQDDSYLPFTVNPAIAANNTFPLPRNSLDGQIFTTLVNFQVNSRPIENARVDVRYLFDNRNNQTPRDVYVYVENDSANQASSLDAEQARRNRPYSYTRNHVDFDAGYTFLPRTELTLGYDWNQIHRDFQETARVWENGVGAELYSRYWSWMTARARYRHSWRNNSGYNGVKPQYAGWSAEYLADPDGRGTPFNPATDFENLPLLRKFYQAAAETDVAGALFSITPIETVGIGINVDWAHDDFDDTQVGLTERETFAAGIDASWSPIERLYTHAFYNYERFRSQQNSWSFNNLANTTDANRRWSGHDKDRAHTVGAGLHVDLLPERLGLDTQYVFSHVQGNYGVNLGSALGVDFSYPNTRTKIHSASVGLDVQATEQIGMRVGYLFERLSTRDWAIDGVGPTTIGATNNCNANSCVIASGQSSPEETSHLVSWSLYYKFFW